MKRASDRSLRWIIPELDLVLSERSSPVRSSFDSVAKQWEKVMVVSIHNVDGVRLRQKAKDRFVKQRTEWESSEGCDGDDNEHVTVCLRKGAMTFDCPFVSVEW